MRVDYRKVFPEGVQAMAGLERAVRSATLEPELLELSLNNQHGLEGLDVVAGQGNRANTQGQVGLVLTSSSEEEAGEPSGTVCPLSVAPGSRSRPLRRVDRDISVRVVTHRQGGSAF